MIGTHKGTLNRLSSSRLNVSHGLFHLFDDLNVLSSGHSAPSDSWSP